MHLDDQQPCSILFLPYIYKNIKINIENILTKIVVMATSAKFTTEENKILKKHSNKFTTNHFYFTALFITFSRRLAEFWVF